MIIKELLLIAESATESNVAMMMDKVDHFAMKTGLKPWHVIVGILCKHYSKFKIFFTNFSFLSVLVCAAVGLFGWCIWRFFRKKRLKDGKKKKDGKAEGVSCDFPILHYN